MRGTWRRRLGAYLLALCLCLSLLPAAALAAGENNVISLAISQGSTVTYGSQISFRLSADSSGLSIATTGNVSFYRDQEESAFYTSKFYGLPFVISYQILGDGWKPGK